MKRVCIGNSVGIQAYINRTSDDKTTEPIVVTGKFDFKYHQSFPVIEFVSKLDKI